MSDDLPATSARIALHADGSTEMDLPKMEDDDAEVAEHVMFIAALGVLLAREPTFMADTIKEAFPVKH